MASNEIHVVTGAFGFSGKYVAKRLLDAGYQVRTLTNSLHRENPFGERLKAYPYNFDNPEKLVDSLRGATVLYNNYWVRFNYKDGISFAYSEAVENSLKLFKAAGKAGIKRIVHISITNPSEDSPFEYFSGKAKIEAALIKSGISYAILRPAVLFGKEDILINNIAWFLRKFPVFGVFGDGNYKLQPIYVDDLAKLAVEQGQEKENVIIDAIGPETFTYRELVGEIGMAIGKERPVVYIPPFIGYCVGYIAGKIFGDVTITRDEIEGLMANLLYTNSHPVGQTRLTEWVKEHAETVGAHYSSELARRKNRIEAYEKL
ncbi:MAG: NAD-dependent epimerase/dehydratase family protein [Nitrospirae bacterium]|nr:MAG: NAD-dependent epimerase/dehydratase family protein [Nitrospirota bacterium]